MQRGDTIISIDGQNVHGYSADEVKKLLSGEQGTLVKILLKSGNKNVEVSLTRRPLQNNNNNNNFSAPRVAPRVVAAPPRAPPPPAEAAHECDAAAGEKERHLALPEEDEPSSGHSTGAAQEWVVEKKFVAPKYRVPGAGGAYYTSVPGDGVAEVKEVRRVALDGPVLDDDAVQMQGEAPVPPPRRRKIVC